MRTYDELKEICMFSPEGYTPTQQANNPPHLHLSKDEIALFCDDGNLPFGFGSRGNYISVYTD